MIEMMATAAIAERHSETATTALPVASSNLSADSTPACLRPATALMPTPTSETTPLSR